MSAAGASHTPQRACSAYAVMPMTGRTGLASLEEALPLVAGDGLVKEPLLRLRVVQVVVDDLVAERLTCHRTSLELVNGLTKRRRNARQIGIRIRVALEHRRRLNPVFEPAQARCEHGCESEVRVRVGAGDARLVAGAVDVPEDGASIRAGLEASWARGRGAVRGRDEVRCGRL